MGTSRRDKDTDTASKFTAYVKAMRFKQHDACVEPGTRWMVTPLLMAWDIVGRTPYGGGGRRQMTSGFCLGHILFEVPEK